MKLPTIKIDCPYVLKKAHDTDVGYDLRLWGKDIKIPNNSVLKVPTGCKLSLPYSWEAQVRGRSGLAAQGLFCHLGTIDPGYTDEISAILFNLSGDTFSLKHGDRIAQLVFAYTPKVVLEIDYLSSDNSRGGFGHTGLS